MPESALLHFTRGCLSESVVATALYLIHRPLVADDVAPPPYPNSLVRVFVSVLIHLRQQQQHPKGPTTTAVIC